MTTQELFAALDKKAAADKEKELSRKANEEQEYNRLKEAADAYLPKVREWITQANIIFNYGYKFYPTYYIHVFSSSRLPNHFDLMTDGVCHKFGFWYMYPPRLGEFCSRVQQMGIKQGGACGERDIHTDGNSWWVEERGVRTPMTIKDYNEFLRDNYCSSIKTFSERFEHMLSTLSSVDK